MTTAAEYETRDIDTARLDLAIDLERLGLCALACELANVCRIVDGPIATVALGVLLRRAREAVTDDTVRTRIDLLETECWAVLGYLAKTQHDDERARRRAAA